jgi:transcriptional regulator with XRE-family HTH domain
MEIGTAYAERSPFVAKTPGRPRKGETLLAKWLDEQGKPREWLAEELDVTLRQVDRWCNGTSRPSYERMLRIAELTENAVPTTSWPKKP